MVVENDKERRKIAGDFQLSADETKNHRYQRAKVIALGPIAEPHLSVGDTVFYQKGRDFTLPINGKDRTIIRLEEVVMIDN